MNQRDLSELRRRLNPDKRNPTVLRGCYVDSEGKVISTFVQAVARLPQEENEKYMALFKKCLSGTAGQNLLPIDFTPEQVETGEAHRLLMTLRDTGLQDASAVDEFCGRAIAYVRAKHDELAQSVDAQQAADNYLILLLHDGYDLPVRTADDELDREQSSEMFSYILCAVCPVRQSKPSLRYFAAESEFHSRETDWVVGVPDLGFLFPAFEERSANVHRALYYTRDAADLHDAFLQSVFNAQPQMTAPEQKEALQAILQETLQEECSLDVVQTMHETVSAMIEEQKADKNAEALCLTGRDVKQVLENCGVSQEKQAAFEERYAESFGEQAAIPAVNVVAPKQFRIDTPNVSIKVDPEHSDLVETRMIDGRYYIVILADGDVEVNGMRISC
ncbi:MAG: DUF4317 domain-containing protein [Eubacteriales bacterium]|nr:DUF4317 domain-containing protein [Eubacteriales bacterium]